MQVKKTIPTDVVVGFRCDICRRLIKHHHEITDGCYDYYMTLQGDFGYGSPMDTEEHICHMCEACYGRVREFIEVVLGGKVQVVQHGFGIESRDKQKFIKLEDLEEGKC